MSFRCFWHVSTVGRFGKATFWDVGFELLLFVMFLILEDLERQRLGMQVLSFCCFWHVSTVGRFGKATFWDV